MIRSLQPRPLRAPRAVGTRASAAAAALLALALIGATMVVTPFVAPAEAQPVGESRSAWPGGDVTGTVTTADGTPVEGATVHATSRTDPRPFEDHRDTPGVLE